MTIKNYNLTGNAPRELKRRGRAGTITLSDRAARFELRRGTIELPGATAALTATVQAAIARAALPAEDAGTVVGDPAIEPADVSDDANAADPVPSVSAPVASVPSVPVAPVETPAT